MDRTSQSQATWTLLLSLLQPLSGARRMLGAALL